MISHQPTASCFRKLPGIMLALLLAGCMVPMPDYSSRYPQPSSPDGIAERADPYKHTHDSAPEHAPSAIPQRPQPTPIAEPRSRYGNKSPYQVLGKTYHVLDSAEGFEETGIASWYGNKFHGHRTSSGDIYDMYGYSAAHKQLPLPTYVEVTNLENGKKVIVKVNDRGPFHDDRIIDLSYAAAHALGFTQQGTARVLIRAINPAEKQGTIQASSPIHSAGADSDSHQGATLWLQLGAFSLQTSAEQLAERVRMAFQQQAHNLFSATPTITHESRLYKLRIGPFLDNGQLHQVMDFLVDQGLGQPIAITLP